MDKNLQDAILECLTRSFQLADGTMIQGCTESELPVLLREQGWRNIPAPGWFQSDVENLGFILKTAKSGRWTRGGFKYCSPCKVWTL